MKDVQEIKRLCWIIIAFCSGALFAVAMLTPAKAADWTELSKLNDPPGQPSVMAAKVATQGLTRAQLVRKHTQLIRAIRRGSQHATGDALRILRREVALIEIAMNPTTQLSENTQ